MALQTVPLERANEARDLSRVLRLALGAKSQVSAALTKEVEVFEKRLRRTSTKVSLVRASEEKDLETARMLNSKLKSRMHTGFRDENDMLDVSKKGTIFLIKRGEETVGTVSLRPDEGDGGVALLRNLEILREHQNKGIGTESVYLLLDVMRERGFKKARLRTRPENKRAIHVYEKVGFKEVDKDDYFGDGVQRVIMEKRL